MEIKKSDKTIIDNGYTTQTYLTAEQFKMIIEKESLNEVLVTDVELEDAIQINSKEFDYIVSFMLYGAQTFMMLTTFRDGEWKIAKLDYPILPITKSTHEQLLIEGTKMSAANTDLYRQTLVNLIVENKQHIARIKNSIIKFITGKI